MTNRLKRFLVFLGGIVLRPFPLNSALYFKVKDLYYTSPSEHLFRAVSLIKQYVKPNEKIVVIDVGAADGSTAEYFHNQLSGSSVIAFEPNPAMHAQLSERLDKYPTVKIKKVALGSAAGVGVLSTTANNVSSSLLNIATDVNTTVSSVLAQQLEVVARPEVNISTLDTETADIGKIHLLKLDVQGYEIEVLRGGTNTLQKTKFVLAEMSTHKIYNNGCSYHELDEFLRNNGFRLVDILVAYRPGGRMDEYDAIYERID